EATLVSFRDGHCQPLRPSPPEIHVDDAAALADGPYFAFHHRETAALGDELRESLGPDHGIIRFGPKAKLALPGRPLAGAKLVGTGASPGLRGAAREPPRQHLVRARLPPAVAHDGDLRQHAAVTVAAGAGAAELDRRAFDERGERRARREARLRPRPVLARRRRRWDLDAGKPDLAPVIEDEAAPVGDGADRPRARRLGAANGRQGPRHRLLRVRLRARRSTGGEHAGQRPNPRQSHAAPLAPRSTKRAEWGGTAATRPRPLEKKNLLPGKGVVGRPPSDQHQRASPPVALALVPKP